MYNTIQPLHSAVRLPRHLRTNLCAVFYITSLVYFLYSRFFLYRPTKLIEGIAVCCEVFFALTWLSNQVVTWFLVARQTYPDRLLKRYDYAEGNTNTQLPPVDVFYEGKTNIQLPPEDIFYAEGKTNTHLPPIDIFITTADPCKEPPVLVVNTILSVLAVDYPFEKVACYISDDGASPYNFYAVLRAYEYAHKWVPFCKRFNIEPRAPMAYFSCTVDSSCGQQWEELKKEYESLSMDIRRAMKHGEVPKEVLEMFKELCGNQAIDICNHPPMIKIFNRWDNILPQLIYLSREKQPGSKHHYKAGALNALARVSGVITNSPFILNLDCDMYVNNSKALLHSMCFHMDPQIQQENYVSFVQFPQIFGGEGIDENDTYGNKMVFTFDVVMRGLDGLQGPIYVGTGCIHRRGVLFGSKPGPPYKLGDDQSDIIYEILETRLGHNSTFLDSVLRTIKGTVNSEHLVSKTEDILQLISCKYEENTDWGKEVGWMYGSSTEDILTGYKMHCKGWKSIYCCPHRPAFIGTAPSEIKDVLKQRKRWSRGMLEIFMSRNCPLFDRSEGLTFLQRIIYIHLCGHAVYSIPLVIYGLLPTFSLFLGQPCIPKIWDARIIPFILMFGCNYLLSFIQSSWMGIKPKAWWNSMRMWMITTLACALGASLEVFLKLCGIKEISFSVARKDVSDENNSASTRTRKFSFDSSSIFMFPTIFMLFNIMGLIVGVVDLLSHKDIMVGELFCVCWNLINLQPFVKGLFRNQNEGGLATKTVLAALFFTLSIITSTHLLRKLKINWLKLIS